MKARSFANLSLGAFAAAALIASSATPAAAFALSMTRRQGA
jgi:hypothetical protein